MFNRKEIKKRARKCLRRHYFLLVTACLIAAFIGADYSASIGYSSTNASANQTSIVQTGTTQVGLSGYGDLLLELLNKDFIQNTPLGQQITFAEDGQIASIGSLEFGRKKGVFSGFINSLRSGQFIVLVYDTVNSILRSDKLSLDITILLTAMALAAIIFLTKFTYKVAFRRLFLESYQYEKVKMTGYLFLFKVRRVVKATLVIFTTAVIQFFWNLTIIGGIIAHYSFAMIPYITAENPDITPTEARKLSRRMMYGHKLEMFKLDLSFLHLMLLGKLTLGISDILLTNPYRECSYVQYYFYLRDLAKANGASYADRLNDVYLSRKADYDTVEKAYADVVYMIIDDVDIRDLKHSGIRGFFEDRLGIIWKNDRDELKYNTALEQEEMIQDYRNILDLKQYPERLYTIPLKDQNRSLENIHYLRRYSVWSLLLLFFLFCFVGWAWEVMLHIVEDGTFVNRGVLHGPWLPIYGSGCVLILCLLFRFRSKPVRHAFMTVLLCGVIEYVTHWLLELTLHTKWWDYSGYFINLNGRICAEGLLVFLLGGMAVVYAGAPLIDDKIRKMKKGFLIPICLLLLIAFGCDVAYSMKHPNTGKGISDYDSVNMIETSRRS